MTIKARSRFLEEPREPGLGRTPGTDPAYRVRLSGLQPAASFDMLKEGCVACTY